MKTLKVFAPAEQQGAIESQGRAVARYEAFVVVEVDDAAARRLMREHPCEDISDQYRLPQAEAERARGAPRTRGAPSAAAEPGAHHHLVQFVGPVKDEWVAALESAGAVLRQASAGFAYVVQADAAAMARIAALPFVRWCGRLPHADRVAGALGGTVGGGATLPRRRALPGTIVLEAFDATQLDRLADAAAKLGFEVAARDADARTLILRFESEDPARLKQQVAALAAAHGVRWIQPRVMPRTSNNVAARIVGRNVVARPAALGLDGEGEIIAVCDTGLDTGDAAGMHPDFAGRVLAIRSWPVARGWAADVSNVGADDGAADTDSGHGTHVAGSVLGDGSASAAGPVRIEGMAPKARLVFEAVEQQVQWKAHVDPATDRFQLAGIPDNWTPILAHAYELGARIHSNSWGGGDAGAYDAQCEQVDRFVHAHRDLVVLVAAGNDGSDTGGKGLPANGRINLTSVGSPACAKNVITVGASENLRPEFNHDTYGASWPDDFPRAPFKDQPMADSPDQVAAFSSRGPTLDGRIKPELVAPGTYILSTRSSRIAANNFAWGAYGPNKRRYFHMGGTSMATPIAAGCAALVREFLRKQRGIAQPSAALVKALLIAGTRRLPLGGEAAADNAQGFGRLDVERSLGRVLLSHENTAGLRTGTRANVTVAVPAGARELVIVLAYTDAPGAGLINNLNLVVVEPGGRRHTGNAGRGGGLMLDASNNVEIVRVPRAAKGTWGVDVVASNVPQGPQAFALVAVLV